MTHHCFRFLFKNRVVDAKIQTRQFYLRIDYKNRSAVELCDARGFFVAKTMNKNYYVN
jgi:hypothetical protein